MGAKTLSSVSNDGCRHPQTILNKMLMNSTNSKKYWNSRTSWFLGRDNEASMFSI